MILREQRELNNVAGTQNGVVYAVFKKYPSSLVSKEARELGITAVDIVSEFGLICRYYDIYKYGTNVSSEGTNGDYVGSSQKVRKAALLINKEARFLFGEMPDITAFIEGKEKTKDKTIKNNIDLCNKLISKLISKTKFRSKLLKAAKDCFIGKRVALVANFNPDTGITLNFLKATEFLFENNIDNPEELETFVAFVVVDEDKEPANRRIFKKKFTMDEGVDAGGNKKRMCYVEEIMYDGTGKELQVITERMQTELDRIPAVVILNDALTNDDEGTSEIFQLVGGEAYYNKLSNSDMDAERKEMAQIRYTVDMDESSTANLSIAPGSYWDLQSDDNKDNVHPAVGTLSSNMSYSGALEKTLKRIDMDMYETIDMPYINLETMSGAITSGKGLKAIYWPLIERTKEKMLEWGPALEYIFKLVIDAAAIYEDITTSLIGEPISPMDVSIKVVQNLPLPEDEETEKNIDIQEVTAQVMSRKSYMKKWYLLSDEEADAELQQIALERQLLEESYTEPTYEDDESGADDSGGENSEVVVEE